MMSRRSNSKNNNRYYSLFLLVALVLVSTNVYAFAPSQTSSLARHQQHQRQFDARTSTTGLFERQWNFNEGQAPWGLKKNAELWNGRVAQVGEKKTCCWCHVFLQDISDSIFLQTLLSLSLSLSLSYQNIRWHSFGYSFKN
jgi:hypothetical protein